MNIFESIKILMDLKGDIKNIYPMFWLLFLCLGFVMLKTLALMSPSSLFLGTF